MPTTRRLEDLFVLGRELAVTDEHGNPAVTVWLQKLNPLDTEKATRKANAAKARMLMARNNPDDDQWLEEYGQVDSFGARGTLIDYLIAEEVDKYRQSRESELALGDDSRWSKDDYLQGLRDAWEGNPSEGDHGLKRVHAEDPDDPEANRVFAELKAYADEVDKLVDGEIGRLRKDFESWDDERVRRQVVDKFIEIKASLAWVREFRACQVWLGTRDPNNHDQLYFDSREAVGRLSAPVFAQLTRAYQEMEVQPDEGKGLRAEATSSPSSEPSSSAETEAPSGLEVAAL